MALRALSFDEKVKIAKAMKYACQYWSLETLETFVKRNGAMCPAMKPILAGHNPTVPFDQFFWTKVDRNEKNQELQNEYKSQVKDVFIESEISEFLRQNQILRDPRLFQLAEDRVNCLNIQYWLKTYDFLFANIDKFYYNGFLVSFHDNLERVNYRYLLDKLNSMNLMIFAD